MSDGAKHCPYVGLKQNRSIQFSTPTAEHRCYVSGDAMEIPVDQASYCLSQFHTQCPLYMGSSASPKKAVPTTPKSRNQANESRFVPKRDESDSVYVRDVDSDIESQPATAPRMPMRTKSSPPPRTNYTVLYGALIAVFVLAGVIYWYAGTMLTQKPGESAAVLATDATATTQVFEQLPTVEATAVPVPATATALPAPATAVPVAPAVATATVATGAAATPRPTARTVMTYTASPAAATQASGGNAVATTKPDTQILPLWLYFGDATGTVYVPVQRSLTIVGKRVAGTAMTALIEGPKGGLQRLLVPDVTIKSLTIKNGTAIVDLDRRPTGAGDVRGFVSMVLTLTQFSSVKDVKFQINGADIPAENGIPSTRPAINVLNPDNLGSDALAVTVYFVANDGVHDVPVTRLVAKTNNVIGAAAQAWLAGPGQYGNALRRTAPAATQLRGINIQNGLVTVDLTQPFADVSDRPGAIRTLVETLTDVPGVKSVQVLIEGKSIGELWGNDYNRAFEARVINPE
jgi:spore germination protein GerM